MCLAACSASSPAAPGLCSPATRAAKLLSASGRAKHRPEFLSPFYPHTPRIAALLPLAPRLLRGGLNPAGSSSHTALCWEGGWEQQSRRIKRRPCSQPALCCCENHQGSPASRSLWLALSKRNFCARVESHSVGEKKMLKCSLRLYSLWTTPSPRERGREWRQPRVFLVSTGTNNSCILTCFKREIKTLLVFFSKLPNKIHISPVSCFGAFSSPSFGPEFF